MLPVKKVLMSKLKLFLKIFINKLSRNVKGTSIPIAMIDPGIA